MGWISREVLEYGLGGLWVHVVSSLLGNDHYLTTGGVVDFGGASKMSSPLEGGG